jgi:CHAT domain-containing protein
VRLADGWLTAERAAALPLEGALVVLSACDTGRSVVAAGDEVLGLQRGFFAAGASSVVMSLWPARDDATVGLMARFHSARQAGRRPAAALREAQLAVRAHHPHPWWWAAFVISGAS